MSLAVARQFLDDDTEAARGKPGGARRRPVFIHRSPLPGRAGPPAMAPQCAPGPRDRCAGRAMARAGAQVPLRSSAGGSGGTTGGRRRPFQMA